MFTGIVEEPGTVVRIRPGKKSTELTVRTGSTGKTLRAGNSIAVNGACLTVVKKHGRDVAFDVLNETLRCTNFGELKTGSLVNLERPMRADGRLDGPAVGTSRERFCLGSYRPGSVDEVCGSKGLHCSGWHQLDGGRPRA